MYGHVLHLCRMCCVSIRALQIVLQLHPDQRSLLLQLLVGLCVARRVQHSCSVNLHLIPVAVEPVQCHAGTVPLLTYKNLELCVFFADGCVATMQDFSLPLQLLHVALKHQSFPHFGSQLLLCRLTSCLDVWKGRLENEPLTSFAQSSNDMIRVKYTVYVNTTNN